MKRKRKIKNYSGRNFKKKRSPDLLSKKNRSFLMSKIRSKGTAFEKAFIKELKKVTKDKGRLNVLSIKGKPDIVYTKKRVCVFLDSDFWHGWQYPRWKDLLKDDFWRCKIEANRKRDKKVTAYLKSNNWRVIRVWEHQIKNDPQQSIKRVLDVLGASL